MLYIALRCSLWRRAKSAKEGCCAEYNRMECICFATVEEKGACDMKTLVPRDQSLLQRFHPTRILRNARGCLARRAAARPAQKRAVPPSLATPLAR
eukprot:6210353-Pleurochrysis_carterae.AAC.1